MGYTCFALLSLLLSFGKCCLTCSYCYTYALTLILTLLTCLPAPGEIAIAKSALPRGDVVLVLSLYAATLGAAGAAGNFGARGGGREAAGNADGKLAEWRRRRKVHGRGANADDEGSSARCQGKFGGGMGGSGGGSIDRCQGGGSTEEHRVGLSTPPCLITGAEGSAVC